MTDEDLARGALSPLLAETPHPPLSTRPSGYLEISFEDLVARVTKACAAARAEGRAEVNREWTEAELERGNTMSDDHQDTAATLGNAVQGAEYLSAKLAALQRQCDDLLAANNRYLERARAAEAKLIDMSDHFRSHDRALDRIAELEAAVAAHKANQIGGCRLTSEDIFFMTQRRR